MGMNDETHPQTLTRTVERGYFEQKTAYFSCFSKKSPLQIELLKHLKIAFCRVL